METIRTFDFQKWFDSKKFVACFLDDDFFNADFQVEVANLHKLVELKQNTSHDSQKITRFRELNIKLDDIFYRLENCYSLDVRPEKFESSLVQLQNHLNGN